MSFGALRVKPDSLKLSVVGYEDHECQRAQEENIIQVENEFDVEEDQVSLSFRDFEGLYEQGWTNSLPLVYSVLGEYKH